MSADPVQAVPDPPEPEKQEEPGRLQRALVLIEEEAVAAMQAGEGPRSYTRAEKLLAIARAVRKEMGTSVEDFADDSGGTVRHGNAFTITGTGGAVYTGDTAGGLQSGRADMRREHDLAQIEALEARRRRDDAAARASTLEEFERLQNLDTEGLSDEVREGIEDRLTEITTQLSRAASEPEETEQ